MKKILLALLLLASCSSVTVMEPQDSAEFTKLRFTGCVGGDRVEDCNVPVSIRAVPLGMLVRAHVEFKDADNLFVRLEWEGDCDPCQVSGTFGPYQRTGGAEDVIIGMGSLGEHLIGFTLLRDGVSVADTTVSAQTIRRSLP